MRVVVAATGTRGDVHPMLTLAGAFAARGHATLLCASPDFEADAARRGVAFRPVGAPVEPYLRAQADAITRRRPLALLRDARRFVQEQARPQFEALVDAADGADLVVAGGVQVAAASAAELHGVPYRYVCYCPSLLPSAEHAPFALSVRSRGPRVNRWLWRLSTPVWNAAMRPVLAAERARLGLPPVADPHRHLLGPRVMLAADPVLAPVPAEAPDTLHIPALQDETDAALPPKLGAFLEQGPPPVYVGFGSMPDPEPAETTRRVLAAIAATGCRAVLSRGWAQLGGVPLPGDVLAVEDAPHAALFRRVAAVVHHGGAGTTTTAARCGAPQIVVPHVFDHFYWGDRVQRLGLGPPPFPRRRLNARRLAAALRTTLDNEALAERTREIAARLRAKRATAGDPLRPFLEAASV